MHGNRVLSLLAEPRMIVFFSSAQLQQLESRLRYSKTDKDTAEKKQRILMEKDLVDLQEKVHRFDVGSRTRSLTPYSHH
jgi:hypothetical protein